MRRILVDIARARQKLKRGGDVSLVHLEEAAIVPGGRPIDLIPLDIALDRLAGFDERRSRELSSCATSEV
jgi:hypothetical protein